MRLDLILAVGAGLGAGFTAGPARAQAGTECGAARPEWLWCDDFEQNRLASYFEVLARNGSFVRAEGVGLGGSFGMRARYRAGQVDAGGLHLALGKTPQAYFRSVAGAEAVYREIWWRVWVRLEPGWTGGGGAKLSRAMVLSSPGSWAQAAIAHVWSGGPGNAHLMVDPASGVGPGGVVVTTTYNDAKHLHWLGSARSTTPVFDAASVGVWRCIEAHARLNDARAANGVFELWVDGQLQAHRDGLNWVGAYPDYGWNAVFLENYWNGGSPKTQERYFDNFVVSTRAIGCGAT